MPEIIDKRWECYYYRDTAQPCTTALLIFDQHCTVGLSQSLDGPFEVGDMELAVGGPEVYTGRFQIHGS